VDVYLQDVVKEWLQRIGELMPSLAYNNRSVMYVQAAFQKLQQCLPPAPYLYCCLRIGCRTQTSQRSLILETETVVRGHEVQHRLRSLLGLSESAIAILADTHTDEAKTMRSRWPLR
jgi:hypothetical protein